MALIESVTGLTWNSIARNVSVWALALMFAVPLQLAQSDGGYDGLYPEYTDEIEKAAAERAEKKRKALYEDLEQPTEAEKRQRAEHQKYQDSENARVEQFEKGYKSPKSYELVDGRKIETYVYSTQNGTAISVDEGGARVAYPIVEIRSNGDMGRIGYVMVDTQKSDPNTGMPILKRYSLQDLERQELVGYQDGKIKNIPIPSLQGNSVIPLTAGTPALCKGPKKFAGNEAAAKAGVSPCADQFAVTEHPTYCTHGHYGSTEGFNFEVNRRAKSLYGASTGHIETQMICHASNCINVFSQNGRIFRFDELGSRKSGLGTSAKHWTSWMDPEHPLKDFHAAKVADPIKSSQSKEQAAVAFEQKLQSQLSAAGALECDLYPRHVAMQAANQNHDLDSIIGAFMNCQLRSYSGFCCKADGQTRLKMSAEDKCDENPFISKGVQEALSNFPMIGKSVSAEIANSTPNNKRDLNAEFNRDLINTARIQSTATQLAVLYTARRDERTKNFKVGPYAMSQEVTHAGCGDRDDKYRELARGLNADLATPEGWPELGENEQMAADAQLAVQALAVSFYSCRSSSANPEEKAEAKRELGRLYSLNPTLRAGGLASAHRLSRAFAESLRSEGVEVDLKYITGRREAKGDTNNVLWCAFSYGKKKPLDVYGELMDRVAPTKPSLQAAAQSLMGGLLKQPRLTGAIQDARHDALQQLRRDIAAAGAECDKSNKNFDDGMLMRAVGPKLWKRDQVVRGLVEGYIGQGISFKELERMSRPYCRNREVAEQAEFTEKYGKEFVSLASEAALALTGVGAVARAGTLLKVMAGYWAFDSAYALATSHARYENADEAKAEAGQLFRSGLMELNDYDLAASEYSSAMSEFYTTAVLVGALDAGGLIALNRLIKGGKKLWKAAAKDEGLIERIRNFRTRVKAGEVGAQDFRRYVDGVLDRCKTGAPECMTEMFEELGEKRAQQELLAAEVRVGPETRGLLEKRWGKKLLKNVNDAELADLHWLDDQAKLYRTTAKNFEVSGKKKLKEAGKLAKSDFKAAAALHEEAERELLAAQRLRHEAEGLEYETKSMLKEMADNPPPTHCS